MDRYTATSLFCAGYLLTNLAAVWLCTTGIIHPPFRTLFLFSIVFPMAVTLGATAFCLFSGRKREFGPLIAPILTVWLAGAATMGAFAQASAAV